MDKNLISSILTVLNKNQSINVVKNELQIIRRKRRGNNRLLIEVVISFLEEHLLPFRVEDKLTQYGPQNIPDEVIASLEKIVPQSKSSYFNATCGEYLWTHTHKLLFAEFAIKAYYAELDRPSYPDELAFPRMALGICRIISKYKVQQFPYDAFLERCITHIESHIDDNDFCNLFVYEALISYSDFLNAVQKSLEKTISHYEQCNNHSKFIAYCEVLKSLYISIGQKEKAYTLVSRIAEAHEKMANQYDWNDPRYSHVIITEIQKSMNEWKLFGGEKAKTERKRLAKRIEPVKRLLMESMRTIKSGPIDISESITAIEEEINHSTFEQVLHFISHLIQLQSKESLKHIEKGFFSSYLFSTVALDSNGRKRYILPSSSNATENERVMIMEHDAARRYSIVSEMFIGRAVSIAKDIYTFSEDALRFVVEDNAFIPNDRKNSFLKGLVAGFNYDFLTAMSVLMPQVENAVRELAVACGAVVFKTNEKGIEECLSMESVLAQPEVVECLDDTFLFNLRLFYVSEYGFGMRNLVSHGLLSDAELNNSSHCLAVWWFTLRICCTYSRELNKRLLDQHHSNTKNNH